MTPDLFLEQCKLIAGENEDYQFIVAQIKDFHDGKSTELSFDRLAAGAGTGSSDTPEAGVELRSLKRVRVDSGLDHEVAPAGAGGGGVGGPGVLGIVGSWTAREAAGKGDGAEGEGFGAVRGAASAAFSQMVRNGIVAAKAVLGHWTGGEAARVSEGAGVGAGQTH